MLSLTKQRILQLQSEICKILSNPKRLQILHELRGGEKTVNELASSTALKQANVSQHLALMRHRKVVIERRVGNAVFYRISDQRINDACDIMQEVLLNQVSADSKLVRLAIASSR
jgi:DNA-binding transcriptional ArsR family regulator